MRCPRFPAHSTRFGPTTAPTVAPQTTTPIAEARRAPEEQVGGGIARQLIRAVPEADQDHAQEEQRQRPGDDRGRGHEGAGDADRVARAEAGSPSSNGHQSREERRADGRPEHDRRARRPAPRRRAGEILGHDRADRDGGDVADAAHGDAGDERPPSAFGADPGGGERGAPVAVMCDAAYRAGQLPDPASLAASSTNRHSAFASRICSGVRARTRSRSGEATTTATQRARDVATFIRWRLYRKSMPRGASSGLTRSSASRC